MGASTPADADKPRPVRRVMATFGIRGGPHDNADYAGAAARLSTGAERLGARSLSHDPAESVYTFEIEAPTTLHAFTLVGDIFAPVFGREWWVQVGPGDPTRWPALI